MLPTWPRFLLHLGCFCLAYLFTCPNVHEIKKSLTKENALEGKYIRHYIKGLVQEEMDKTKKRAIS